MWIARKVNVAKVREAGTQRGFLSRTFTLVVADVTACGETHPRLCRTQQLATIGMQCEGAVYDSVAFARTVSRFPMNIS